MRKGASLREPVNLSAQLRHVAFVTDLVHRLHRHDRVVGRRQTLHPVFGSEIGVHELGGRKSGDAVSTHFEHRLGKSSKVYFAIAAQFSSTCSASNPGPILIRAPVSRARAAGAD